jgi:hypothetical protein
MASELLGLSHLDALLEDPITFNIPVRYIIGRARGPQSLSIQIGPLVKPLHQRYALVYRPEDRLR